jgi:hypothetical protein
MAVLYGFHGLVDILDNRAASVDQELLSDAINAAVNAHNMDVQQSLSLFANKRLTDPQTGVNQMAEGELQPLDEWGRPQPRRTPPPVSRYFPLYMAGDSIATNYVTQQKMTVQEVNDRLASVLLADTKWLRRQILTALFTNTSYNFTDPQYGTLAISTLANGDAETFLRTSTGTASTDTHHKGNATFTEAVLTDMRAELVEHDENGGDSAQVLVLVPTASKATVQGFTNHKDAADPNITVGTGVNQYTGSFAATAPGTSFGYNEEAQVHLREWSRLPADYAIAITDSALSPLAMRQDEETALQGFHEIPGREDTPYLQRIWIRRAGFAAYNRVGAVVYRTNNGTYAIPTGYSAPNP